MDVEEPKSTTRLVRCALLLTCVSFIGCQKAAQEKTLVDLYPDHSVFGPARLSEGEIAIEDGSGTFGASVAIGQLQFSDEAHILLRSVPASPGFTVRALSEDMARGKSPLPAVKCSTTWVYANESIVKDDCILSADPAMLASYQERTRASLPAEPFLRARLAPNLREGTYYRCRYTVKGVITCHNTCVCGGCVTCDFRSLDGLVVQPATRPARDADATNSFPCNSKNQCN